MGKQLFENTRVFPYKSYCSHCFASHVVPESNSGFTRDWELILVQSSLTSWCNIRCFYENIMSCGKKWKKKIAAVTLNLTWVYSGSGHRSFPIIHEVSNIVILYCFNLKIKWIDKSVTSLIIQRLMTNWFSLEVVQKGKLCVLRENLIGVLEYFL